MRSIIPIVYHTTIPRRFGAWLDLRSITVLLSRGIFIIPQEEPPCRTTPFTAKSTAANRTNLNWPEGTWQKRHLCRLQVNVVFFLDLV